MRGSCSAHTLSCPSSLMVVLVGSSVPILYQNLACPPRYSLRKGKCCRCQVEPGALHTFASTAGRFVFVFFRQIFGFLFFMGCLGLKGTPHFRRKNKKPKNPISQRLGRVTLNTCAKIQGLTLKNGVDIWTLVRLSEKSRFGIVITWF